MQSRPFSFELEIITMATIVLIVYKIGAGWYTVLIAFLVISLWFITGENGFYHGYTYHKK